MPREVSDPTPPSVRQALDVVARHGHLSPEKLGELPAEDFDAIRTCVVDFMPRLAVPIIEAQEAGDRLAVWNAWATALGWINRFFDQESTWDLHALPKEERERFRTKPVNPITWRQLRGRARWHMAHPRWHTVDPYRPRSMGRSAPRHGGRDGTSATSVGAGLRHHHVARVLLAD